MAAAVDILLPLYVYPINNLETPYDGPADWRAAIEAIDAHPDLTFNVIINHNSGPPFLRKHHLLLRRLTVWIGS
ncbi:hypothetical protein CTA1_13196 [Colletotrichum tanaceti]|uniref:Uncharacterized protein n=1 Tax=Colletotrichum tanaceti TaxID=1306861 RepID=A0A4U6X416_9PEZI|nr:hypothetical protein CTA1_13196 [Colletotrichum tanaceti]